MCVLNNGELNISDHIMGKCSHQQNIRVLELLYRNYESYLVLLPRIISLLSVVMFKVMRVVFSPKVLSPKTK